MAKVNNKRKSLSLQTKINILEEVDKNSMTKTEISSFFDIPKSTLSTIIANRQKIYDALASGNFGPKSKKMRPAKYEDIESLLDEWIKTVRASNIPVSGVLIKEKATSLASEFEIPEFKASDGWLSNFVQRHNLSLQTVCGELLKVNEMSANDWLTYFSGMKSEYAEKDIFNMDEAGIFFNLLPERRSQQQCQGKKLSWRTKKQTAPDRRSHMQCQRD